MYLYFCNRSFLSYIVKMRMLINKPEIHILSNNTKRFGIPNILELLLPIRMRIEKIWGLNWVLNNAETLIKQEF